MEQRRNAYTHNRIDLEKNEKEKRRRKTREIKSEGRLLVSCWLDESMEMEQEDIVSESTCIYT